MPGYPGQAAARVSVPSNLSPIALQQGESHYLFGLPAAGATQLPLNDGNVTTENLAGASIAVALPFGQGGAPTASVAVEVIFPGGAPGAGESIAIQEADTDADAFYITMAAPAYTINAFNANNAARADLFTTGGKFLRVNRTKGANNQPVLVKVTRLA